MKIKLKCDGCKTEVEYLHSTDTDKKLCVGCHEEWARQWITQSMQVPEEFLIPQMGTGDNFLMPKDDGLKN